MPGVGIVEVWRSERTVEIHGAASEEVEAGTACTNGGKVWAQHLGSWKIRLSRENGGAEGAWGVQSQPGSALGGGQ